MPAANLLCFVVSWPCACARACDCVSASNCYPLTSGPSTVHMHFVPRRFHHCDWLTTCEHQRQPAKEKVTQSLSQEAQCLRAKIDSVIQTLSACAMCSTHVAREHVDKSSLVINRTFAERNQQRFVRVVTVVVAMARCQVVVLV